MYEDFNEEWFLKEITEITNVKGAEVRIQLQMIAIVLNLFNNRKVYNLTDYNKLKEEIIQKNERSN
jgi:hypothetical protein